MIRSLDTFVPVGHTPRKPLVNDFLSTGFSLWQSHLLRRFFIIQASVCVESR